jgi:chorismate dehydratase
MVNFINTAPVYDVWQKTVNQPDWYITEATPAELNRKLFANDLDMGLVSSQEYAIHPHNYLILDDLSISASGPVGSVFLFLKCAPETLSGKTVLLSNQSQTSVSLVKIILERFYGVLPRYKTGAALEAHNDPDIHAVLAIGDEALILAQNRTYDRQMDLGRLWYDKTGLPFVYALWVVRKEFCRKSPETVSEIHKELLRCRKEGKKDLKNISKSVARRVSMELDDCYEYLRGIKYDLDPDKKEGLICFIEYLIERGEGSDVALPLKIYSGTV